MPTHRKCHVCSECIGLFDPKFIYMATKPGQNYSTLYCKECIELLKIEVFQPYIKPRTKKAK